MRPIVSGSGFIPSVVAKTKLLLSLTFMTVTTMSTMMLSVAMVRASTSPSTSSSLAAAFVRSSSLSSFRRCRVGGRRSIEAAMTTMMKKKNAFLPGASSFGGDLRRGRLFSTTSTAAAADDEEEKMVWTTDRVRSTFIEYFRGEPRDHTYYESSPCAPLNDPTLLFTNAGMNQFKSIFLGRADPETSLATLKRAVNSQKCIRAGGKHNDLDDVGKDTYHHTFFEMLGTWSFGDYFKVEAIDYAWDLLTEVYGLDPDRLYATYFEGNDRIEPDFEARDHWLKYLPAERVIACNERDNFWEMGDVGPCGPCSEVHYDRVGDRDASGLVNADDPDVIEIWNIVFIQYNKEDGGAQLQTLPAKHIDTGMGLERLVSILQDKSSNYDIDCFQEIFRAIRRETKTKLGPYTGRVGSDDVDLKDTAYRAIADHIRTLSFAIADGVVPNNEGRGYVLRRVLRRAIRYGQQILGADKSGFFASLVPVVVDTFGATYPELVEKKDVIMEIVREEEEAFSTMLDRGIKYFNELQHEMKGDGKTQIPGTEAFYLYDTLGFPIDLTELMAEDAGMTVDVRGFENEMELQKQRSRQAQRASRKLGGGGEGGESFPPLELIAEQTAWLQDNGVLPTDDSFKYKWDATLPATVMAIFTAEDGFLADSEGADRPLRDGEYAGLVLDKTSFYSEAGGQEADIGRIDIIDDGGEGAGTFDVHDVQVYGGYILHKGVFNGGGGGNADTMRVGTHVNCNVRYDRRRKIAPNHSMTHVLNAALRKVLGDDVDQRGSLCNDEKLRFDFSYKKALTAAQLEEVEEICRGVVKEGRDVTSRVMPLEEARAIEGVRAVFGEVYPDPVRVVSIGDGASVEFCGGTHVSNTAEAAAFALVEETAVAKGIRRITAVTGDAARDALSRGEEFVSAVSDAEQLPSETADLDKKAGAIRKELDAAVVSASLKVKLRGRIESIQRGASEAKKKALQQRVDSVLNGVKDDVRRAAAANEKVAVLNVDIGADSKSSQRVMNTVKKMAPDLAFFGVSEEEPGSGGKLLAFAAVPESMVEDDGLRADEWVRAALEICGGRGGGKPGNAQGQAKECPDVKEVIAAANAFAQGKVNAAEVA